MSDILIVKLGQCDARVGHLLVIGVDRSISEQKQDKETLEIR